MRRETQGLRIAGAGGAVSFRMLEIFSRLGLALGLGLLVGLQRERTDARIAGFRTFPLVTLFGALCGLLAGEFGEWILVGGLVGLALVILGGNLPLLRRDEEQPGVTTEVMMLLMFAVGVYLTFGTPAIAIATCGAAAVLLHLKPELHSLAAKIGDADFKAIMQFTLITLVILPVLPDEGQGPFNVLNPFKIWLMVVLIVGISLGGYVAYKVVGARAGAWASGLLGGLISSTATTVSVARRGREDPRAPGVAAFIILVASAVVFIRVGLLIAATDARLFRAALLPCLAMFVTLAAAGIVHLRRARDSVAFVPEQTNPSELKAALLFGFFYAVVLLGGAAAHAYFGSRGLYVVALISGLADMDAITLSVSQLVSRGEVAVEIGWRLILVAALSNLAFKAAVIGVLGNRPTGARVLAGFGLAAVAGSGLLLLR